MKVLSHQTTSDILQTLLGPGGTILNLVELLTVFASNGKKNLVFQRFRAKLVEPKTRKKYLYCQFYQQNEGEEGRSLCCTTALSKKYLYLCPQEKQN